MKQDQNGKTHQQGPAAQTRSVTLGSVMLGVIGCVAGLVAGVFLLLSSYPFLGPSTKNAWRASVIDGAVITAVGIAAFLYRKKSAFIQGILVSTALLFIVNGLCGMNAR